MQMNFFLIKKGDEGWGRKKEINVFLTQVQIVVLNNLAYEKKT